ncbi:hypothetical protein OCL06_07550 [Alteromonas sp. ASW11-19]|uniref:Sulfotransferase domain-containing protein n=1 Tax=Alteromonas salexigens TaxID=2982530 RepID=A0ABT2VMG8_9ALTE|nr:hypothetical protein [Alteromonas salexigens]MCU7554449.1 hypothetical protein [Alteromonas salexigens]
MVTKKLDTLYLHIGCEKTGTTSIQHFTYENRDAFEKSGIRVCQSLGKKNNTKIGIYAANEDKGLTQFLGPDTSLQDFRDDVQSALYNEVQDTDCSAMLISCEWLHSQISTTEEFERLRTLFECVASNIQVIMYIRPQHKMAISHYATALKAGYSAPFTFPNTKAGLPYYYNFEAVYQNWCDFVGSGNVTVRVFQPAMLKEGDLLQDFASLFPTTENLNFEMSVENQSLSIQGVNLLRALNYWQRSGDSELTAKEFRKLRQEVADSFKGRLDIASEESAEAFLDAFATVNEALFQQYFEDTGDKIQFV